jgi:hypothetical protein
MNATRLPLLVLASGLVAALGLAASASSVAANGTAAAPSTTAARPAKATAKRAPAAKHVLPFIDDDLARALAEARKTNRPVFVESWAPW